MQVAGAEVFSCAVCSARLSTPVREVHPPAEGEAWTPLDSPVEPCPPPGWRRALSPVTRSLDASPGARSSHDSRRACAANSPLAGP